MNPGFTLHEMTHLISSDPAYFDAVNFSTKWHGFRWILQAPDILGIAIGWHMRLFRNCNNLLHRLYFRHLSPNLSCLPQSKKKETITYKYAVCRAQHTVVQASLYTCEWPWPNIVARTSHLSYLQVCLRSPPWSLWRPRNDRTSSPNLDWWLDSSAGGSTPTNVLDICAMQLCLQMSVRQSVESQDSFPHKQQKQGLKTNKQSNEHKRTIIIINNLCWKKFQALCQELSRLNWVICCQQHSKSLHPQPGTRSASTENSWALGYCGYWLSAANSWTPGSGQNIFEPMRTYKCNAMYAL